MELLNHYLGVVNNNILPAAAGLGLALELGMRLMPTKKPMSAAYVLADALKKIGEICTKLGEMLDRVLPQKVKGA
jgi:hypothetical protein